MLFAVILILLLAEADAFKRLSNFNILLDKPARHKAAFDVMTSDDDSDPEPTNFHCSNCESVVDCNWWICDMRNSFVLGKAVVYGRHRQDKTCRLDSFIIGVSTDGYGNGDVTRGSYHVCFQHQYSYFGSGRVEVNCTPPTPASKYLIVQQPAEGMGGLTLCEVEAWALMTYSYTWRYIVGVYQSGLEVGRMGHRGLMECLVTCKRMSNCYYVNWNASLKTCILVPQNTLPVLDAEWVYYFMFE